MADNIQVSQGIGTTMATDDVSGVQYPRVKLSHGVDGSAVDASSLNPLPVSGPLTNAELRASAIPVSVTGGGDATAANQVTGNASLSSIDGKVLTDAQLRASAIPVSGPLTDVQLRATAVPVSVSGVATSALQTSGNSSLSSIDGKLPALSGGRVPVDIGGSGSITITSGTITVSNEVEITNSTGSPIPVSGTVTANTGLSQPLTDAQLRATSVPVTGPLTDVQLRATAVPVSGTVTANTGLTQPLTDAQLRATAVPVSGPLTDAQLRASAIPVTFTGGGDASAANQTLQITEATLTNTKLTNITGTDGVSAPANALVVGGITSGGVFQTFETNASGHLNISDGGGSITVDGPLTDSQLRAASILVSGPLTDVQLRATAVAVAPNVTMGAGVIDSNTQRVTLATDGATAVAIGSIDSKTPALDNSKQPVIPSMTSGGNISVTTAATGTNWTAFASQALKQLTISNQTGTNIEFRQGGAGVGFIIPAGAIFTFFGITNANQIEARRTDTSNTQVTITSRWES